MQARNCGDGIRQAEEQWRMQPWQSVKVFAGERKSGMQAEGDNN